MKTWHEVELKPAFRGFLQKRDSLEIVNVPRNEKVLKCHLSVRIVYNLIRWKCNIETFDTTSFVVKASVCPSLIVLIK